MKKVFILLGLAAISSAVAVGVSTKIHFKQARATSPATDLGEVSYIAMEAASFTDYSAEKGAFVAQSRGDYAGRSVYSLDTNNYYSSGIKNNIESGGYDNEDWTGTLTTKTWLQKTQYVSFQWGGASNVGSDATHLKFHYGDQYLIITNTTSFDGFMFLKYFKIPDSYWNGLTAEEKADGVSMYLEIVDGLSNTWRLHNFGNLRPNQTEAQVGASMQNYVDLINASTSEDATNRAIILNHYNANADLRAISHKYVSFALVGEDFEDQGAFQRRWVFDDFTGYLEGGTADMHFDKTISFDNDPRGGESQMPFNKTGNGFFRGWYEGDERRGFVAADNRKYRFLSMPMTLGATPFVSIKMAGKASLQILDPTDYSQLVEFKCTGFNFSVPDGKGERLLDGFNTVTMQRYVINLQAFHDQRVIFAIADYDTSGWSAAYFDDFNANWNPNEGFKVEEVIQAPYGGTYAGQVQHFAFRDVYVPAASDSTATKAAYDFLTTYFSTVRTEAKSFSYCGDKDGAKSALQSTYLGLLPAAKTIVDASQDFHYGDAHGNYEGSYYLASLNRSWTVGQSMNVILNGTYPELNSSIVTVENNTTAVVIIVAISSIALLGFAILFAKKKKQN